MVTAGLMTEWNNLEHDLTGRILLVTFPERAQGFISINWKHKATLKPKR